MVLAFGLEALVLMRRRLKRIRWSAVLVTIAACVAGLYPIRQVTAEPHQPSPFEAATAFASAVTFAVLSWKIRARSDDLDKLVVRYPRFGDSELRMGGRIVMGVSAIVFLLSLRVLLWQGCLDGMMLFGFGYYLAFYLGQVEIYGKGVRWWGFFRPWERVRCSEWEPADPPRLRISPFGPGGPEIRVECDPHSDLARALRAAVPR